jgi:ribA/ribD-fused uncharacterized protein
MTKSAKPRKLKPSTTPIGNSVQPEVHFYRSNEKPFGAFSNLYRRPVIFEGREYPTAEHAYQAGKASKEEVREWILSAPTPALAAMAAHGLYTWDVVPNWSKIKFDRMRSVLRAKFTQHEDLRDLLLSTGSARLVEAGTTDNAVNRTWGEVNGKGKNMLGILLMELREELCELSKKKVSRASVKAPRMTKTRKTADVAASV